MSYEAWRITFQSSEQAARAAFEQYTQAQIEKELIGAHLGRLQALVTPEVVDLIRCGIGSNYGGECYDAKLAEVHAPLLQAMAETPDVSLAAIRAGRVGPGGAHNCYVIGEGPRDGLAVLQEIRFQQGHPNEQGFNGVTLEALLAVCMDRLEAFQVGPYPCNHNQEALQGIERALEALKDRTRERTA